MEENMSASMDDQAVNLHRVLLVYEGAGGE